jgi:serine/threonine protein kinase
MTETGSIIGTAQYLTGAGEGASVTPASDIYSVRIVLYEMLTGLVPFTGDTPSNRDEAPLDGRPAASRRGRCAA